MRGSLRVDQSQTGFFEEGRCSLEASLVAVSKHSECPVRTTTNNHHHECQPPRNFKFQQISQNTVPILKQPPLPNYKMCLLHGSRSILLLGSLLARRKEVLSKRSMPFPSPQGIMPETKLP